MRGNEAERPTASLVLDLPFPIPMRGNETREAVTANDAIVCKVSNPHEG